MESAIAPSDQILPGDRPPPLSCDCHLHVFGDPARYPRRKMDYTPPEVRIDDMLRLHVGLGIDRAVLVQTSAYGTTPDFLLDTLKGLPSRNYRGFILLDSVPSDSEFERMNRAGIVGVRFNFLRRYDSRPDLSYLDPLLARMSELGWIAKLHLESRDFSDVAPLFHRFRGRVLLDHLGRPDFRGGLDQPGVKDALETLRNNEDWWALLSYGQTSGDPPWDRAVPFGRAFFDAAPDRVVWGSDWPHLGAYLGVREETPDEAALLRLMYRYLPTPADRRRVLVDNPARLFGFAGA